MHRSLHPLRTLFLATIFVVGNLVLPQVDIFLDHGLGAPQNAHRVHLERPGGCRDHAEHCVLSRLLGNLDGQAPAHRTTAAPFESLFTRPARRTLPLPADRYPSSHRSRAPPAPLL